MGQITLKGYICERCGHKWVSRFSKEKPRVCPKCKSPYWDVPRKKKAKKEKQNKKGKGVKEKK